MLGRKSHRANTEWSHFYIKSNKVEFTDAESRFGCQELVGGGNGKNWSKDTNFSLKILGMPWMGGSIGWSMVPYTQKVVGLIPSLGTYLGCRFVPWPVPVQGYNQLMFLSHVDVSLSLSFPSSLFNINKHILRWGLNKREFPRIKCIA